MVCSNVATFECPDKVIRDVNHQIGRRLSNGICPLRESCLFAEIDLLPFADEADNK